MILFFRAKKRYILYSGFATLFVLDFVKQLICDNCISGILGAVSEPFKFSIFAFLTLSFLSFDFCYDTRLNGNTNILENDYSNRKKTIIIKSFVLLIPVLFVFVISFIGVLLLCVKYNAFEKEIVLQLTFNVILSFLIIPICAVFLGMACSIKFKRVNGYLVLILFTLLGSPLINDLVAVIYESFNLNIYKFISIFDMFPPSLDWQPIYAFGHSVLSYRWFSALFWFFLLLGIIWFDYRRKSITNLTTSLLLFLTSIVCLLLFVQPTSKLILSSEEPQESIMSDYHYYSSITQKDYDNTEDFEIKSYDLEIKIRNELIAKATIQIDVVDLDRYNFTLYNKFKIEEITDGNGNKMNFSQEGDHFTVYNKEKRKIDKLSILYKGHSGVYYTNRQGVFLPGYFPYYPHSGHKLVYDNESQGFRQLVLNKPILFDVKVFTNQNVFCNLESIKTNHFKGFSTGLTLLSGLYKSFNYRNISIIYPYLNTSEFSLDKLNDFVSDNWGTDAFPLTVKTVLVTPSINNISPYTFYCCFSDSLVIQSINQLDMAYQAQNIEYNKNALYSAYNKYTTNPSLVRSHIKERKEQLSKYYSVNDLETLYTPTPIEYLIDYLDYYGEKEGLDKIEDYLKDTSDNTHWKEFIKITR